MFGFFVSVLQCGVYRVSVVFGSACTSAIACSDYFLSIWIDALGFFVVFHCSTSCYFVSK